MLNVLVFGGTGDVHHQYLTFILLGLCVVVDRLYRQSPARTAAHDEAPADLMAIGRSPA